MSRFNSMIAMLVFAVALAVALIASIRLYRFMSSLINDFEKLHNDGMVRLLKQQRRSAMIGLVGTITFTVLFWWALNHDLGPCW